MSFLQVQSGAIAAAMQTLEDMSPASFYGEFPWESQLLIQERAIGEEGLGHLIMRHLLAREKVRGEGYATKLRQVITMGIAPLFITVGGFEVVSQDDFEGVAKSFPKTDAKTRFRLALVVGKMLAGGNQAWAEVFRRCLENANLTAGDERFTLCVVLTICTLEEQYIKRVVLGKLARKARQTQQDEASDDQDEASDDETTISRESFYGGLAQGDAHTKPIPAKWELKDIGGCKAAKRAIAGLAWLLLKPEAAQQWGSPPPVGVLLTGPPGNGKTMLAHALARHTGKKLYAANMSDILAMWVGLSNRNLRNWFLAARKTGGVLFFDEADGILSSRETAIGDVVGRRIVNEFCTQIEALPQDGSVVVVLATNFKKQLDEAAVRARRIDEIITVPKPESDEEREEVLVVHRRSAEKLAGQPLFGESIDLLALARVTRGLSGADLSKIITTPLRQKAELQASTGRRPQLVQQTDLLWAARKQRDERITKEKIAGFQGLLIPSVSS